MSGNEERLQVTRLRGVGTGRGGGWWWGEVCSHLLFITARVAGARVSWVQPTDPRGPHPGSFPWPRTPPPQSTQGRVLQGDSADSQLGDMVKAGRLSSHSC